MGLSTCTTIVFLEGLLTLDEILQNGLDAFGFRFISAYEVDELAPLFRQHSVDGILVDLDTPDGQPSLVRLQQLKRHRSFALPMVAMSQRWDVPLRLQAIKAGCDALVSKPLDYPELARTLESLTHPSEETPYRVLVVEDSRTQAEYMRGVLEQGGLKVEVVTEPLKVLDALPLFQPDLILMDLYMPDCDGPELAALIRMGRAYLDVPIVYLSLETDRDKQLSAMRRGADDFLTKGLEEGHLLASVRIRAERTRLLRSLVRQDSLTGLLNHSSLKGRLAEEVVRATRSGLPLSFSMVDIDHFKRVNDSFGHGMGDQVIQSLAFLLRRRLRRTDVVGRYGGEEFGLVLPETSMADAVAVVDGLRAAFGSLSLSAGDHQVQATFSAGVATLEPGMSPETLCEAADTMLYVAKRAGRNRVEHRG